MHRPRLAVVLGAALLGGLAALPVALAQAPTVKVLQQPEDPREKTILIGRQRVDDMIIMFELEPAKSMWMLMGQPPQWVEHAPAAGEAYHVEVKPIDPGSNTRISYARVTVSAVNLDTNRRIEGELHPMWGGSGLHYAINSTLAGDGTYRARVTVGVPAFGRDSRNVALWRTPRTAEFHFRLQQGRLVEVTEPTE